MPLADHDSGVSTAVPTRKTLVGLILGVILPATSLPDAAAGRQIILRLGHTGQLSALAFWPDVNKSQLRQRRECHRTARHCPNDELVPLNQRHAEERINIR